MYKNYLKRVIDFLAAFVMLSILFPFLLIVWIWLTVVNIGAGALFFQERLSKDARTFKIMKFKTMTDYLDKITTFVVLT